MSGRSQRRRVVVVGAGAGGLACAVRLARAGHAVTVLEAGPAVGGKLASLERDGFTFDTGPSLLTMPWVVRELLGDALELVRVEPVTRYRFADGSTVELSADLPRAIDALERWSPGAGADWVRFLGTCAQMWRASVPFLTGPPPWPPRRPGPGEPPPDPRDLLRVRSWWTLSQLARAHARDPRLRMVIERFATYAGADPRRAPAALAVAGYVEHAFGAWHVPGGLYEIARALADALGEAGGELRLGTPVRGVLRDGRRVHGVLADEGPVAADAVVWNGDALALERLLAADPAPAGAAAPAARRRRARRPAAEPPPRSLSGLALMLGLRDATPGRAHHEIAFPADYGAEFDDVFAGRPARDPALYTCTASVTDSSAAPAGAEARFVLVNAPARPELDWDAEADRLVGRLGIDPARIAVRAHRGPADLERESGAVGGAIYGAAPHGRLASVGRPGPRVRGVRGLYRVGGTAHPGGGLPLALLGGATVARMLDADG